MKRDIEKRFSAFCCQLIKDEIIDISSALKGVGEELRHLKVSVTKLF
jgi:hypothetical protein